MLMRPLRQASGALLSAAEKKAKNALKNPPEAGSTGYPYQKKEQAFSLLFSNTFFSH
jgi:hypothetical protein